MNINKAFLSYAHKVSPTSLDKGNFRKMEDNVPNDADYDVGLLICSVCKVGERLKNSLYGYLIGRRLVSPIV